MADRVTARRRRLTLIVVTGLVAATALAVRPSPAAAVETPVPAGGPTGGAAPAAGPTVTLGDDPINPLVPGRLMDSRPGQSTVDGQFAGTGAVGAGQKVDLTVTGRAGVPAVGVSAVVLNVTVTGPTAASHVTVWPAGASQPLASNVNVSAGQTAPNLVVAKVGAEGKVSMANASGSVHLVVDVAGWFPEGSGLHPLVPGRLMDSRPGQSTVDGQFAGTGAVGAGQKVDLTVTGRAGVPATGVAAVVLNVTVTGPTAPSFVTVWPAGAAQPLASNLNMVAGQTVPNLVVAKVGADGNVSIFNSAGSTHLVVDVAGWFAEGSGLHPLVPGRLMDSRAGQSTVDGQFAGTGAVGAGQEVDLTVTGRAGVPAVGVSAVVLNVTVTGPTAASHVTVWPAGASQPLASNVNVVAGQTAPNLVVAKVGADGKVSMANASGSAHLVVDVAGWFSVGTGASATMQLADGTVLAGAGDVVSLVGGSDVPSTVVLSASADVPAVGGVLVAFASPATPQGFLGRVTATSAGPGGTTTVTTVPTALDDAFVELDAGYDGAMGLAPAADGASAGAAPAAVPSSFGVKVLDGACKSTVALFAVEPPDIDVSFEDTWVDWELSLSRRYARLEFHTTPTITFDSKVNGGFTCSHDFELPFEWPILGALVTLDPSVSLSWSVSGETEVHAVAAAPTVLGFEIDDFDGTNLSDVDFEGSASITGSATTAVRAGVKVAVKVFGVAGVEIGFFMEVRATHDPQLVPCNEVTLAPVVTIGVKAELWVLEWSVTVAEFSGPPVTLFESDVGCPFNPGRWTGTIGVVASGVRPADPSWSASANLLATLGAPRGEVTSDRSTCRRQLTMVDCDVWWFEYDATVAGSQYQHSPIGSYGATGTYTGTAVIVVERFDDTGQWRLRWTFYAEAAVGVVNGPAANWQYGPMLPASEEMPSALTVTQELFRPLGSLWPGHLCIYFENEFLDHRVSQEEVTVAFDLARVS